MCLFDKRTFDMHLRFTSKLFNITIIYLYPFILFSLRYLGGPTLRA